MSYQQRERKRRAKVKAHLMVQGAKRTHSDETAVRYYLIYARKDCRCAAGGCVIPRGQEMVYRRVEPVLLCVLCADKDPAGRLPAVCCLESSQTGQKSGTGAGRADRERGWPRAPLIERGACLRGAAEPEGNAWPGTARGYVAHGKKEGTLTSCSRTPWLEVRRAAAAPYDCSKSPAQENT